MTYEEAMAWLRGERSTWSTLAYMQAEGHVLSARADAANTEQAYWIVRAHHEGLLDEEAT